MKRQKQKAKQSSKGMKQPQKSTKTPTRRDILGMVRTGAVVTVVAGGLGWFVVDEVVTTLGEQDFEKLGNGIPTIVQIHDPQCSMCLALQRQAREALQGIERGKVQYLVANIRSAEGRAFADQYQVGHVTLLLFDKQGRHQSTLSGPNQSDYLLEMFQQHLDKFS